MTTYLVTRHEGTRRWATIMARRGRLPFGIDEVIDHLDPAALKRGDVVVGTLPIHTAAELHARGVKFWSLDIDTPPAERGQELSGVQLVKHNARLTRYEVRAKDVENVAAARAGATPKAQPALTLISVSDALAPAAIGYLHEPTEQVHLLASKAKKPRAKALKKWLEKRQPAPKVAIVSWDDTNYATLLEQAEDWVTQLALEDRPRVVVNLTGGTKPMSMALQRACGKRAGAFGGNLASQYVDTDHGRIEDLLDPRVSVPMRNVLNLADQLALQGFIVQGVVSASPDYADWLERGELFKQLLDHKAREWLPAWYELLAGADWLVNPRRNRHGKRVHASDFADVEWQGDSARPSFTVVIRNPKRNNWNGLRRALQGGFGKALRGAGVANIEMEGDYRLTLGFDRRGLDELAFASGAWMEAWLAAQFAAAGVDEWAQGVTVKRGTVENEFDLVLACGNRMLLVEAKTAKLDRDGKEDSRAAEALYKLDALSEQLGRYFGQRWLVSLRPLDRADRERAAKHRIRVFEPGQEAERQGLDDLPKAIADWVGHCRLECDQAWTPSYFQPPA